jgi:PemK-like, MazF-like toxin of type II toxin-antitoxin system
VPIGIANLTQDSVILCEQIRVIDKSRIIRVIGHLDRDLAKRFYNLAISQRQSYQAMHPGYWKTNPESRVSTAHSNSFITN